jgi:multiple sugar transport system ATP-binding protein
VAEVQLQAVTKRFHQVIAVNNLTLTIPDRELVTLVGPSGCGKSTTLYLIAGLEKATSGDIFFNNQVVTELPARERDVAVVFQNYALYPHMTIFDNIAFNLRIRKVSETEIRQRVQRTAEILNISELLQRRPSEISGGQQQRAALGRAIVREPQIYLMDEPLSNLDAKMRVTMRAEIKHLHRELGVTTIFVTHDQEEAMTISDKIAVMNLGQLQQYADPEEIYNHPANLFVAGFIGSPTMNLFEGNIYTEDDTYFLRTAEYEFALGKEVGKRLNNATLPPNVVIGIRSEDIQLIPNGNGAFMTGHIDLLQPVGPVTYAEVILQHGVKLIASTSPGEFKVNQPVQIRFVPHKIHYFNQDTGTRLPV